MACKLDRPTPDELFDSIKEKFEANVLNGYKVIPESNEWYVVSNDYMAQELYYSIADQVLKSFDPREACCEDLYALAANDGIFPRSATFSQGYAKITGLTGTPIPAPLEINFNGSRFKVVGCSAPEIGAEGYAVVRIQAIIPGPESNGALSEGTTGSVSNTFTGLDPTAEAYGNHFCGGRDEETCEEFRTRYIDRKTYKPKADYAWIIDEIKEWPCVTRVAHRAGTCCTYPEGANPGCTCNSCTNGLEFYPLFDDTFDCGIPPACVIDDMNVWLFGAPQGRGLGRTEIGVCGMLYQAKSSSINVRLSGLTCATMTQVSQIKERIQDLFGQIAPSQILRAKSIEILISQVMGDLKDYPASFEIVSGDLSINACGDLVPACDVLPCLNEIIVVNAFAAISNCG